MSDRLRVAIGIGLLFLGLTSGAVAMWLKFGPGSACVVFAGGCLVLALIVLPEKKGDSK